MPLEPEDARHAAQIKAGVRGRRRGHLFEKTLTEDLNRLKIEQDRRSDPVHGHLRTGHPARELLRYILADRTLTHPSEVRAWWLGGLATSGEGDVVYDPRGNKVEKSKSDVLLQFKHADGVFRHGISVKTCSKRTPTNDQLFCTTARAFCNLLRANDIPVSTSAERSLRMFCGDEGLRPIDQPETLVGRQSNPERWFFEELPDRKELETLLTKWQREITTVLLQKAYPGDPFPPEYVLHQTVAYDDIHNCELALFRMEELVECSCLYQGFVTRPYRVHKGRFKDDPNEHLAPRFGFIQMQQLGNKQNRTQLQFNLEAAYFYKLPERAS